MNSSVIPQILLQAAILILAGATAIDAMAATDKNSKDRQAVHRMQLQLTAAQQEKAELADQVEALKKQVGDLESKRTALERKSSGQSKQIADLSDKQQKTELSYKQQLADLSDKYQETEKKLKQVEQQYSATSQTLQQTKIEKEQEKKRLDGNIQICEKKNFELYQLSVDLMEKYQAKGVLEAMRQAEPFTQLEKVRVENMLQEYRDKSDANRISSGNNGVQDVQHP